MAAGSTREKGPRRGRRGQAGLRPYAIAVVTAAVVATVLIVVLVLSLGDDGDGGGAADGSVVVPTPRPTDIAREGHLLGSAGAPVTVIEYGDFQ